MMHYSVLSCGFAVGKSVALATVALLHISVVFAQSRVDTVLAPVVVTASRFANDPVFPPIGATVVTYSDIRDAGIDNVNEAIRKLGGVYGRQSLAGPSDFSLDLRGFGASSDQNVVIMLDGVRVSENEQVTALLSAIPIDSVERIEIVRGGSSVLYGDGATGGVIQIVTKRPAVGAVHGAVVGEVGNNGLRSGRVSVAKGWDGFALNAAYSKQHLDNYRDNNASNQENFSGSAQWFSDQGRFGLRVESARADYRLPGGLSMAQFLADPRQASNLKDFASYDSDRITAFFERRLGDFDLATELSHREKIARSNYRGEIHSRTTQFSPRVRHVAESGLLKNEFVSGLDLSEWEIASVDGSTDAAQRAKAVYVRDELQIVRNARIALGWRHELVDKSSKAGGYAQSQALNAWDLQASYAPLSELRVFTRTGQSYRLPNVDDNNSTTLPLGQVLKPQVSHDLELGATWGGTQQNLTFKWFRHLLNDEIYFDPTIGGYGANVNLDPTKRQGVELEANVRVNEAITLKAYLQHVTATFREGVNAGKELALVPKNTASARVNWQAGNQNVNVGLNWVDTQRYGNDFNNNCYARIPSFTTLDARYAVRVSDWELALTGGNLLDKNYYSQAFGCASGIYPEAGRTVKLTARYVF